MRALTFVFYRLRHPAVVITETATALIIVWLLSSGVSVTNASEASCGTNTGTVSCDSTSGNNTDPGSAPTPRQADALLGNPINLITGNKYQHESDVSIPGSHLGWTRHYNSANANYDFGLGRGWSATFLANLQHARNASAALLQSNGRRVLFGPRQTRIDAEGNNLSFWQAILPSDGTLTKHGDYHFWSLPDGRKLRFKGHYLTTIEYPGDGLLFLYYEQRRLKSVTDQHGRELTFTYYPDHRRANSPLRDYDAVEDARAQRESTGDTFGAATARLQRLTLPDGSVIEYDYDTNGNLTRTRFADGTSRIYHYEHRDYPSHLSGITDRLGNRVSSWDYNDDGYAISSERAEGVERVTLTYDLPAIIGGIGHTHVTNSLGEQSSYTWQRYHDDGQALLLQAEGSGCKTCPPVNKRYTYTDDYQLSQAHDTRDSTARRWTYDEYGRTVNIYLTGTDGIEKWISRYVYADDNATTGANNYSTRPSHIVRASINPEGEHRLSISYNDEGLPVSITENGFTPQLSTTSSSDAPAITGFEPIQRTTTLGYIDNRLTRIDGPRDDVDDSVKLTYHGVPDATAVTDSSTGKQLSYQPRHIHRPAPATPGQPPVGSLASVIHPSGESLAIIAYNAFGQPTELQHNGTQNFELEYDDNRHLIALTHRGNTQRYHYDAAGHVIGMTDANGRRTQLDYDNAGRLQSVTDDLGQQLQWLYDTESRRTGEQLFGVNGEQIRTLSLVYDQLGQLASQNEERLNYSTGNSIARQTNYNRDANGQLLTSSNPENGRQVDYTRNPFGQLLAVSTPFSEDTGLGLFDANSTSTFTYDIKGRLDSVTDARNNTTTYVLDDFGRKVAEHHPDTGVVQRVFDTAGNTITYTNANGDTTTTSYDKANRPLIRTNPDGITSYEWHPNNGQLTETSNSATNETFDHNDYGQLIEHTRRIDNQIFTTTYGYDTRARLQTKRLPDGTQLRYHYYQPGLPNAGQLKAITRESWLGFAQETLIGEIDLDSRDGVTRHINHNGSVTEKRFHPDGSLQSIAVSDGLQLQYNFDDNGQITGIDRDGTLESYSYLNGRLSTANTATGQYQYRYDVLGNKTGETIFDDDGVPSENNYVYAEETQGNRLIASDQGSYNYSATGAPTNTPQYRYTYNSEERPIKVFDGNKLIAEYSYNSFGERIKKVVHAPSGNQITYFLYDGHQLTAEITTDADLEKSTYNHTLYLGFAPVVYIDKDNTYSVQSDHLGTPQIVSDERQQTVWQASYTPYGEASVSTEHITFNHRLPGQYHDEETGIHYNYLRDYDPATGRYLTSDPIGLLAGANTYAYVGGNPIRGFDPMGLFTFSPWEDIRNEIKNTVDETFTYVQDQISEASEWVKDEILGGEFEEIATQVLQGVPDHLRNDPRLDVPTLDSILPSFDAEAIPGIVATLGLLVAGEKVTDFIIKKPTAPSIIVGLISKYGTIALIKGYLWYNYGDAAINYFNVLRDIGSQITDLSANGYSCEQVDQLSQQLAGSIIDLALSLGTEKFGKATGDLNLGAKKGGGSSGGGNNNNNDDKDNNRNHAIDLAFKKYKGPLKFAKWWEKYALDVKGMTLAKLRNYAKKNNWRNPYAKSEWLYPPENGFSGSTRNIDLRVGQTIDRFGAETGSFLSPEGTKYDSRALPPDTPSKPYYVYEVLQPVPVTSGRAAAWFGYEGGGTQYLIDWDKISQIEGVSVDKIRDRSEGGGIAFLVRNGYLDRILVDK